MYVYKITCVCVFYIFMCHLIHTERLGENRGPLQQTRGNADGNQHRADQDRKIEVNQLIILVLLKIRTIHYVSRYVLL
jgi:hypothetical protein